MTRPFTPESLADRWEVSAETVRQLCRFGVKKRRPGQAIEIWSSALFVKAAYSRFDQGNAALAGSTNQSAIC